MTWREFARLDEGILFDVFELAEVEDETQTAPSAFTSEDAEEELFDSEKNMEAGLGLGL